MRLHVVALPHTQLTDEYLSCAYSQKLVKFGKMMKGWDMTLYANDITCDLGVEGYTDYEVLLTEEERAGWFGEGFDTAVTPLEWDAEAPYWALANERAIEALLPRAKQGDLLLLVGGNAQKPIMDAVPTLMAVEPFVGYSGIIAEKVAFESYAWMHWVYGQGEIHNGRVYDAVIPNYFDPLDFLPEPPPRKWGHSAAPTPPRDYLLFVGRMVERKGPHIAAQIAARLGMQLVCTGPGGWWDGRWLKTTEGLEVGERGSVIYTGEVGKEERATLMHGAAALLAPTKYIEPFGGVVVEAMMSGTPVVASDWGSFPEIVTPETGRIFRTPEEGCAAVKQAVYLDRRTVQDHAIRTYSLAAIRPQFDRFFQRIETLWGEGYYT